jgi:diguanylate cyclase (GGDEF)-like protein/PAS domain S-box-containing protein
VRLTLTPRFLFPWILLSVLGAILLGLYIRSTNINELNRNQVELDIRQALALNTQIDLDTLRLRHRQLFSYDSLATGSRHIDNLIVQIENEFGLLNAKEALKKTREEWNVKKRRLDDFKRQNSVLVNSIYHFVNLSNRLRASSDKRSVKQNAIIDTATLTTMFFISDQQKVRRDDAQAAINAIERGGEVWSESDASLTQLLAAHGRLILANHAPVQRIMQEMSLRSFARELGAAYSTYLDAHTAAVKKTDDYRKLMTIFSLFMIIAVIAIILKLQQTAEALTHSNRLLHNINEHLSEGILGFDDKSELTFINKKAETLIGREIDDLLGKPKTEVLLLTEDTQNAVFDEAFSKRQPFVGEAWLNKEGGARYPALFLGGPMPLIDGGIGYVASFRDITTQHEAEARLRLAARVFDNLSEAMMITDSRGRIQSVNAAFSAITGYSEKDAIGSTPGRIMGSGQHDKQFYRDIWGALKREGKWHGEIINRRKNGELFPEWLSITSVKNRLGVAEQYIALFSDISDRKQAEAHIHRLAYYDPLTGLANRALFNDRLENAILQSRRSNKPLVVMYLDLDRFKSVNDSLGHPAGDKLLKQVGAKLKPLLRDGDTLSRFGGDEFAILVTDLDDLTDSALLADKILHTFEKPFDLDGREIFCSTSIGVTIFPADAASAHELLKNADVALYNAKSAGRATFQYFQDGKNEDFLALLELETALRHAVDRGELRLYYQPQVDSKTEKIYGVEALVRWQHPTLGLIPPDRFISAAEHIGYIETLGAWCLETACKQIVEWQKMGVPISRVAVNVSPIQLKNPRFTETTLNIIKSTGVDMRRLELELTESSMTDDPEKTIAAFSELRKNGIRIAIDDFGTGYSSLSYLARYPVDVLKIDKSFVQGIGETNDMSKVVRSIALLAHTLSMEIVAEGVETIPQRDYLREVDCELLQGYYYSRPVPPETLLTLPCVTG